MSAIGVMSGLIHMNTPESKLQGTDPPEGKSLATALRVCNRSITGPKLISIRRGTRGDHAGPTSRRRWTGHQ